MGKRGFKMGKEIALAFSSIIILIVITILTSFITCGFDVKKMFSGENTFNLVTNAAITVMGIISSIPLGIVLTKQHMCEDGSPGRYQLEYQNFYAIRQKIECKRGLFGQWHSNQYVKECREKQINYLLRHNVLQPEAILKLSVAQVNTLTVSKTFKIDGAEVVLNALTKQQIKACVKVLSGKIKVHKLPDFYFLYVDNVSNQSFYDTAYTERKDETKTVIAKLFTKVTIGLIISCILTGFLYDLKNVELTPNYIVMALLLMLVRIYNALTSVFAGISTGQELVYKMCYYINGKTQFLKSFDAEVTDCVYALTPDTEPHNVIDLTEGDFNGK